MATRRPKPPTTDPAQRALVSYPTTRVAFASLRMAAYNARTSTDAQTDAICRSILTFGLVDPFVARAEDQLMVGGHQRAKALTRLLDGKYVDPQTGQPVAFSLPDGTVPVVLVPGLSDKDAKLLNLALNKVGGDWDDDKLDALLKDLIDGRETFDDLLVTGFSKEEIDELVTEAAGGDGDGTGPLPAVRSPKLTLDFSSKEIRDAVKSKIVAKNAKEPSGDVLARLLRVYPAQKAPATSPEPAGS